MNKIMEMLRSEDVEMANLGVTLFLETEPNQDDLRELLEQNINKNFNIYIFPDIISGTLSVQISESKEWGKSLFIRDPTQVLKLIPR